MLHSLTALAFFLAALVNADRLGDAIRENPSGADAPFDYLPVAPCAGLKPCMHTTPADRAASRCTDIMWDGEWKNEAGASQSGPTPPTKFSKTAVDTRFHFHPAADQACDFARAHKFSSLEKIKGEETEATQNHLHERLAPLFGNRLWLTLGTSIDHRMTRNCPTMYGAEMVNKPGGWAGDLCVVPGLNLTIGYHFLDGLTTTHEAATAETQRAALAKVGAEWAKVGYPRGPDFVTFGGAEWDFKHFTQQKKRPNYEWVRAKLSGWLDAAAEQWPRAAGLSFRTTYYAPKAYASAEQYTNYTAAMAEVAAGRRRPAVLLRMDKLMRNGGAQGWSDGLHPAPLVTLAYIDLVLNVMADIVARRTRDADVND